MDIAQAENKKILTKLLSLRAERNSSEPNKIDFLIYSDLGNFYRDSILENEGQKELTNVSVEIDYEGVRVGAKLNGYIENDIHKKELCLRGKLKFKVLGIPTTIDLDKDCDPY